MRRRQEDRAPSNPISLAAPGMEGDNDQASSLPSRIARYSAAKERALAMVGYLETLDVNDENVRRALAGLQNCGNYLHFRHYFTVGDVRLHAARFCKQHLICPLCAIRRGSKALQSYLTRFYIIKVQRPELSPYLITFTVKNGHDLEERFRHLSQSFKRLKDRRRNFLTGSRGAPWTEFAKLEAGVGSYETTEKGNGWHPHIHLIGLAATAPCQRALRAEWEAITGDSFMVDVRPFRAGQDPAEGFMEVMKYAVKHGDLTLEKNWQAAQFFKGRRLLFSFGLFRGVTIPESLLDEPLEDLPYFDLFYRYCVGQGYALTPDVPDAVLREAQYPLAQLLQCGGSVM